MRRLALLIPALLLVTTAPAATAGGSACGGSQQYVDTLTINLPAAPTRTRAGSATKVPVSITRAGTPAADVLVHLRLEPAARPDAVTYGSARTGADGRADLVAEVHRASRGPLRVTVEAFRPVAEVPCYGSVEEHGLVAADWGLATS